MKFASMILVYHIVLAFWLTRILMDLETCKSDLPKKGKKSIACLFRMVMSGGEAYFISYKVINIVIP